MSSFILRILTLHLLISPTFCIIYFLVSCLHCSVLLCINFSSLLSLLFLSRTTSILDFPSYYFPSCLVSSRLGASLTSSCLLFCLCLLSPNLPLLVFFSPHLTFFTCVFSPVLSCKSFCAKTRWDETRQKVVEGKICCSVGQVDLPCVFKPCTHRYNAGVSSAQISDCITLVNNLWFSLSLSLGRCYCGWWTVLSWFGELMHVASWLWSEAPHTHWSTEMREKSIFWDNRARAVDLT